MEDKIMKKTYLEPNMEVVKIAPHKLMSGSPNAGIDPTKTVDPGQIEAPEADFDFWDE